ncbi:MAG: NAD(P)H-hydrate epimerase, partial [Caldimonas sp.]
MRRAGEAVARLAIAVAPHARQVWIAAGPGNNGGDGFEAAFCLRRLGKDVRVTQFGDAAALPPDAADALGRAREAGVAFDASEHVLGHRDLAIDGLLGIGASRPPQGDIADAIRRLNAAACGVLAIDVPSGLNADTGQAFGQDCVTARHTLSLLTLKTGLFTASGRDHAGQVWLDPLGIEPGDAGESAPDAWLRGDDTDSPFRAARRHATHKGSYGDVAVVGGAEGMTGATILAARAAHAGGAGRVYVVLLHHGSIDHDPVRPELMFRPDWCDASASSVIADTTVVCGCGGGEAVRGSLPRLLSVASRIVVDADALNAIAADRGLHSALRARATRHQQTVLTPHP